MSKRTAPRCYVDLESTLPIRMVISGDMVPFALRTAKKLLLDLSAAVKQVDEHFQCGYLLFGKAPGLFRCTSRGSIRIGNAYYCRVHARQAAKAAKVKP